MYLKLKPAELWSSLFLLPYFAMIVAGLVLPSDGNHGLMTPKSLSFLGSCFLIMCYFIARRSAKFEQLQMLSFMFSMISLLLLWLYLGAINDSDNWAGVFDQFKIFVITLSFVIVTLYLVSEGFLTPQRILRFIIFANFFYSSAKLLLVALHTLRVVNMWSVTAKLGIRFMSMEMVGGFSRFQTSVDVVTPFFILFVLQSDVLGLGFSKRFKFFYCLISAISILFSFSRFLMGVAFMSGVLYWATLSPKRFLKALVIVLVMLCVFIALVGPEAIFTIIHRRFFSNDNYYSDLTRVQQIEALMEQYYEAPYLGQGLGGYVKNMIRDGGLTYSYEVQWVAFLMQLGLFGLTLLLIPVFYISSKFILCSFDRVKWSFFGMFLIWLFSGFTNPFLISLASGIVYSMFLLAGAILQQPQPEQLNV